MITSHRMMPHVEKNRFYNYPNEPLKSVFLTSCLMYARSLPMRQKGIEQLMAWHMTPPPFQPALTHPHAPHVQWIGHASFLIQYPNITVLTDPVFENITFLFKRHIPLNISRESIPQIDVVIISHNHRDHMERATLVYLAHTYNPLFLVPKGDAIWLHSWGITNVREAMWWDQFTIEPRAPHHNTNTLSLMFLPARHWSQRSFFDINRSLWGSWMLTYQDHSCYFAGDTAYGEHFRCIAHEFPTIDIALMPIGPCEPFQWLKASHINAEQAGNAFLDLKAKTFIPMHWGTFGFGIDRPLLPLERITAWWNSAGLSQDYQFIPLRTGQMIQKSVYAEKRLSYKNELAL